MRDRLILMKNLLKPDQQASIQGCNTYLVEPGLWTFVRCWFKAYMFINFPIVVLHLTVTRGDLASNLTIIAKDIDGSAASYVVQGLTTV